MGALIRPMLPMYSWRIYFPRWILIGDFLSTRAELSYLIDGRIRYCAVELSAAECNRRADTLMGHILTSPNTYQSSYHTLIGG